LILHPIHAAGDSVQLRYRLQPNASYEQKMSMSLVMDVEFDGMPKEALPTAQALMSGMEQEMDMTMLMYVGEAEEDGSMSVEYRVDDVTSFMTMAGQRFEVPGLQATVGSQSIKGRIGPDGRAIKLDLDELTGLPQGMTDRLMQSMPSFPDKEMAVGDSFEMPVKMSMPIPQMAGQAGGGASLEMDGKVVYELRAVEGREARFQVSQTMIMGMDSAEEEEPATMKMEASGDGTALFDVEEGIFTNVRMEMTMHMKMGMGGLGNFGAGGTEGDGAPLSMTLKASGPVEITMARTGEEGS
jgi:hypothetical protein